VRILIFGGALLVGGCVSQPGIPQSGAAPLKAAPKLVEQQTRPKMPFRPTIKSIRPLTQGTFANRDEDWSGKYLGPFDSLEAGAAMVRVSLSNRERHLQNAYGIYTSGELVEFRVQTTPEERAHWKRDLAWSERRDFSKPLQETEASRPKPPAEYQTDVWIPAGYGPKLLGGKLVFSSDNDQLEFPIKKLPTAISTDVERLPAVVKVGGGEVTLRRGMSSLGLAPDPADDPKGHQEIHRAMQYTAAFFTTKMDKGFAPGRTLDLVMRLRRTKWSNSPGPWFVVRARDVLNPDFEVIDEYGFNVDPAAKMAEFECVLVQTKAELEKILIPNVGSLKDLDNVELRVGAAGRTASGWKIELLKPDEVSLRETGFGDISWPVRLVSPSGKRQPDVSFMPDPLVDSHFVTDFQLSGQGTKPSSSPGEPSDGPRGDFTVGSLGDASLTICHLTRKAHPPVTLRLPLLKGGKPSGQELYMNSVNVLGEKPRKRS
jgi:hypothetical protein